jgi:YidC/Oxa1 family membrane protein insertase
MFMAVIFLGIQLFFNRPQAQDTRSVEMILASMRDMNQKILDISIAREQPILEGKVNDLVSTKEMTAEQAYAAKLEGLVLKADTEYRAGIQRNDFGRLSNAYNTLHPGQLTDSGKRDWTSLRVALVPHKQFPTASLSPNDAYSTIYEAVNKKSKTDLIMGIVPGYDVIDVLVRLTGSVPAFSYAFAGLVLALIVRLAIFPLAQKQYLWGRQMSQLKPLMDELRERFSDKKTKQITDPAAYQAKTLELYKEYGLNPFAGCWPMFIQIPFFLLIYQCMLHYRFEFQKGTFLWINEGPAAATNGFIAPNLGERDYILIVIYAISMVVTTLLTPVSDPTNVKQQRIMGVSVAVIFSIMMFFYPLPSAFTLYWIFTNVFATIQMLYVYRMPAPPLRKVNAPGGGVYATDGPDIGPSIKTGTPVRHRAKKKK